MKKNYYLIGWGLTLTFINFVSLPWLSALIDIAAYFMVYVGLSRMQNDNPAFKWAKMLALLVMLLTVVNAFIPESSAASGASVIELSFGTSVLSLIFSLAAFALIYAICDGTKREAEQQGDNELASKMKNAWWLYFIPSVLVVVILLLFFVFGESAAGVLFLLMLLPGLLSLIGMISIIVAVRRAGRDLSPEAHYETYEGNGKL